MIMLLQINYKKIPVEHKFFFTLIRVFCPFCRFEVKHKIRKYDSLKSLSTHIATSHKTDCYYPFSFDDIHELMKNLALAKQWGILE